MSPLQVRLHLTSYRINIIHSFHLSIRISQLYQESDNCLTSGVTRLCNGSHKHNIVGPRVLKRQVGHFRKSDYILRYDFVLNVCQLL